LGAATLQTSGALAKPYKEGLTMLKLHTSPVQSNGAAAKLRDLYERFREVCYEEVTATVYGLLSPLSRGEVMQAARHFGISRRLPSKAAALAAITGKILDRKGSFDRCQFRTVTE
jgi:hypothetical protein